VDCGSDCGVGGVAERETGAGSVGVRAPFRVEVVLFSDDIGGRLTIERAVLGSVGVRAPLRRKGVVLFSELMGGRLIVVDRGGLIDEVWLLILPDRETVEGRAILEDAKLDEGGWGNRLGERVGD